MRISEWSSEVCSSDSIEALEYVQSLVPDAPQGGLNANSGNMRELFLNGSLAMEFWPALEQPALQQSKLDWNFAVGHAPEGKTPVGTSGGWNLAIYDSSENKIGRASGRERVCQEV